MSKPWDVLRKPVERPFVVGAWKPQPHGPTLRICAIDSRGVDLKFGGETQMSCLFTAKGLRQFAELFAELADQMESQ